jgi:hypothetical protein
VSDVWIRGFTPANQSLYCLSCTMNPKVENLCVCVLYLDLNSGPQAYKARTLPLESMCQHIFYVWYFFFSFFFLLYWSLNSRPTSWAIPPALLCEGFFWDRVLNYLPMLAWTAILLISASWVVRITSVSHGHPAYVGCFFKIRSWKLFAGVCQDPWSSWSLLPE